MNKLIKKWKLLSESGLESSPHILKESGDGFCIKKFGEACDFEDDTWQCEDFWKTIHDNDLESNLNAYFEELYPDGLDLTQFNDILRFDGDRVLADIGFVEEEEDFEEIEESKKIISEDVSKKYDFWIYDIWGNETDGFDVNDKRKVLEEVEIKNIDDDNELLEILKEKEILTPTTRLSDVEFESSDGTTIEVVEKSSNAPIGAFVLSYGEELNEEMYGGRAIGHRMLTDKEEKVSVELNDTIEKLSKEFVKKFMKAGMEEEDAKRYISDRVEKLGIGFTGESQLVVDEKVEKTGKTYLRLDKRKDEAGDFIVKAYENGKRVEDDCYYTNDWKDAKATFKDMAKRMKYKITQESDGLLVAEKK